MLLALVLSAIILMASWLSPSVERSRIQTARVERGSIEGAIEASGTVVPEFDAVITSPIDAQVVRILKRIGDSVVKGESLVILDAGAVQPSDALRYE
jgi:HlyD family secretion protein